MSKQILKPSIKKRGDVYWARLDDAEGYEQQNERPVVIISNNKQNEVGKLLVVVPLSRSIEKIYPFQVATFFNGELGKAKCEQVRAITHERLKNKLGFLSSNELEQIEEKLVIVLALEDFLKRKIKEGVV